MTAEERAGERRSGKMSDIDGREIDAAVVYPAGKMRRAAIVLAAGSGKRMQSRIQKQYMLLDGRPLLCYALSAFEQSQIDDVILVTAETDLDFCQSQIVDRYEFAKVRRVIAGGAERYHSVYQGLKALEQLGYSEHDCVLIHDGARPFVDNVIIDRIVSDIKQYGACAAGMPSKDTVKLADKEGFARVTPNRSSVWTIQTPQGFFYGLIRSAYEKLMSREDFQIGVTDDAMVVETMTECRVKLTKGSYQNLKITTPEDLPIAEALLKMKP